MTAAGVKVEPKMEVDIQGSNNSTPNAASANNNANNRGNKRRRGGGAAGPGRNFFGGRGGGGGGGAGPHGFGGGNDRSDNRRNFHNDNFDGPMNKKPKMGGMFNPEGRVIDKLRSLNGPTADLPPKQYEVKKFLANTRLYIGNISNELTEGEIKELFAAFGEIDELFLNREKNFAFLKLDFRTNAERARSELDQKQLKGRPIKVRFAPATVRVKVKNLSPMVSNELLELAFSIFGEIERALVFVDEKGKSLGEGIVDFTRKNNALAAHKFCTDKCYFLTSDLRPVVTEMGDMYEVDEGLLEVNMPKREHGRDRELVYYKARELGPRVAEDGSFEHDYATKWKSLIQEYQEKEKALKEEMVRDLEKLQTKMEMARYDYETEMLRQQLRQREIDQERQKMQWEQRMDRMGGFGGGYGGNNNRMGGDGGGMGPGPRENQNQGPPNGMNQSLMEQDNGVVDVRANSAGGGGPPLAPPPMPPQGLMQHLQSGEEEGNDAGPTWEIGPFGFNNQMSGNFGQPPAIRTNDQQDRFMGPGPRGPPRGGMGGPRGGPGPRGGRGGFRGGPRGVRR